jgi:hypothetical protein
MWWMAGCTGLLLIISAPGWRGGVPVSCICGRVLSMAFLCTGLVDVLMYLQD